MHACTTHLDPTSLALLLAVEATTLGELHALLRQEQTALAHANAEDLEELAPDKVRLLDAVAQAVWARDALLAAHGFPAGDRGIIDADAANPAIGARCGELWGEVMRLVLLCHELNRINGAILHQLASRTSGLVASLTDLAPFSPHGHS